MGKRDELKEYIFNTPGNTNPAILEQKIDSVVAEEGGEGGSEPVLISKTITENGTYNAADDNADGYSEVVAEVPSEESDFSTAHVVFTQTFLSSNPPTKPIIAPIVTRLGCVGAYTDFIYQDQPVELEIVLSNGAAELSIALTDLSSSTPVITGDAEFDEGTFYITGDCNITLNSIPS